MKHVIEVIETVEVHHTIEVDTNHDYLIDEIAATISEGEFYDVEDAIEYIAGIVEVSSVEYAVLSETKSVEYFDDYME